MPGSNHHTYTVQDGLWIAEIDLDLSGVEGWASDGVDSSKEVAKLIIEQWSDQVQDWMRANAPWTDRTTDARRSLGVLQDFTKEVWELVLTGGVHYQEFLETNHAGDKYAILRPALEEWAGVLIERLGAVRN